MSAEETSLKTSIKTEEEDELHYKEVQDTCSLSPVQHHEDGDGDHYTSQDSVDSPLVIIKTEPEDVGGDQNMLEEDDDDVPPEWPVQYYECEDENENHLFLHELSDGNSSGALESEPEVQRITYEYESQNQHDPQQVEPHLPPLCEADVVEVPQQLYSDAQPAHIQMWSVQRVGSKQILELTADHDVNTNDATQSSSAIWNRSSPGQKNPIKKIPRKRKNETPVSASCLLDKHSTEHTQLKRYCCPECGNTFAKSSVFHRHMRIHTGQQKLFQCSHCDKCFTQSRSLKSHQRSHTGEKPYQCSQCAKTFTRLDVLQVHQKIHTGEKPYICPQCGKGFSRLDGYQNHCRTHTGEKPYQCSHCAKTFARLDSCQNHQMTHTGEKPYQCSICERRFLWLSNLKNHERTHTEERPYRCSLCEKTFIQSGHLTKHLRKHIEQKI